MSTSSRYDSIAARLSAALPALRPRLAKPLTCVLVGMSQALSSHQQDVADAMPLSSDQASKIQRFRRLLDNAKLSAERIYQPIVRSALSGLRRQRVHVLLDRVVLTSSQNVLVVSLGFRRRSIPLAWRVLEHAGSSKLSDQQTLLSAAIALLPPEVRILVHADSEFRSQTLFAWLRDQGWDAMLGIRGSITVTSDLAQAGQRLESWLPDRESVIYLNQVWLSEEQHGPLNVLAWMDKNDRNELICHAVMTNLPASWQTYRIGSRRMWIETLFRDWQSGGFDLGKTAISDPERFARLIILVCLVYLWFVSLGRWLVKRGYRRLLDSGPSDAWHRSLFSLAIAWQNRCRTFDQPLAVFWFVYI